MANIDSSDDLGTTTIVLVILFTFLASLTVWARFWSRSTKNLSPGANDYVVLTGLAFSWGIAISNVVGCTSAAYGRHMQFATNKELVVAAKISVAFPALWGASTAAVKSSVLLLYLGVFRTNRVFRIATYFMIALSVCFGLSVIVAGLAMCRPMAKQWDPSINGTCGNTSQFYIITGVINMVIDLVILVWPLPMLWGLQMKLSRKIQLTLLFGVGILVCVITALRIFLVYQYKSGEITRLSAYDAILATLEPTLAIICACVPVMRPVPSRLKSYLHGLTSGFRGTSHRSLRSSSVKIGDDKPLTEHADVNRLYPLSEHNLTVSGTERDRSLEYIDAGMAHD